MPCSVSFFCRRYLRGRDLWGVSVGLSGVMWVSVVFQAVIWFAAIRIGKYKLIRKAQPEAMQEIIVAVIGIVTLILTFAKEPIFPSSRPAPIVIISLLIIGITAPLMGLVENWLRRGAGQVFDPKRFWGHLFGNCFGALAAGLFFAAGQTVNGFTDFARNFSDASAFNIVLPITTLIIFAFVRQQQTQICPKLDQMVKDEQNWAEKIRGYSLLDLNQIFNCVFLIAATFIGASTILYLFSFSLLQAKSGTPVEFSLQIALAILALVGFLLICGSPLSWDNRTVYFTFLTGTPGVLIATMVWLALLKESFWRNLFAVAFVGAGYILYCAAVVLGVVYRKSPTGDPEEGLAESTAEPIAVKETFELHYFAAAILFGALTVLLGVLRLSHT